MQTHGKGPRDVLMKGYGQWQRGRYRRVKTSIRGSRYPNQLIFIAVI